MQSVSDGIVSVWRWGTGGVLNAYDYHLRPSCPTCTKTSQTPPPAPPCVKQTVYPTPTHHTEIMTGSVVTRLAGISGALAIGLGAYGAHALAAADDVSEEQKKAFEVANRYHLIHSVALLGLPLVRRPRITGTMMVGGMVMFCGTTYYHALTGDKQYRRFTPYGGMLLILAWLSMAL